MKTLVMLGFVVCALAAAPVAGAVPPALLSVSVQDRHAVATFSAPRASATIYFSSKPDRATDGRFLDENTKHVDFLTDSEVQSGRWMDESQLDPGTYWVMLRASADFGTCWVFDAATYDPACADGFSNVATLVVPKPTSRYTVRTVAYRFSGIASLELKADPLGEDRPYRVCYSGKTGRSRCVAGMLNGYSWNTSASDSLTVRTRDLRATTTFTWYVDGRRVASKRIRVR